MECFLQGLRAGGTDRRKSAHKHVARLLWLLLQEDEADRFAKVFVNVLAQMSDQAVPSWLWLPALPTILSALMHPAAITEEQAKLCKGLLKRMAQHYPQATLPPLRAHVNTYGSSGAAAEVLGQLRAQTGEAHLVADMDLLYDQLSVAARPTRVQRVLLSLLALNHSLWRKFPTGSEAAAVLPPPFEAELRAAVDQLVRKVMTFLLAI